MHGLILSISLNVRIIGQNYMFMYVYMCKVYLCLYLYCLKIRTILFNFKLFEL